MVKNQHIQTHMDMRKQSALKEVLVFFFLGGTCDLSGERQGRGREAVK